MAKKAKSKEFILKHDNPGDVFSCTLSLVSGLTLDRFCYEKLHRYFNLELEPGEKKRVRITIEEVK